MRAGLAGCANAVVARRAGRRDGAVIEASRAPGDHGVAGVAGIRRRRVAARLALGARSVVTAGARASGVCMVEAPSLPRSRQVAVRAGLRAGDVIRGPGGLGNAARAGVTCATVARGVAERSALVTALARHPGVSAGERELRPQVVEALGLPGRVLRRRWNGREGGQSTQQQRQRDEGTRRKPASGGLRMSGRAVHALPRRAAGGARLATGGDRSM